MESLEPEHETIPELTPSHTGVWLVTTEGANHIWDLGTGTITRYPKPDGMSGSLDRDGDEQRIIAVIRWPVLGESTAVLFPHPDEPLPQARVRTTSPVQHIERLG